MSIEKLLVVPKLPARLMHLVPQAYSEKILSPSHKKPIFGYQLHSLETQIAQGQELLASGKSQYPEHLKAQMAILEQQRTKLLQTEQN